MCRTVGAADLATAEADQASEIGTMMTSDVIVEGKKTTSKYSPKIIDGAVAEAALVEEEAALGAVEETEMVEEVMDHRAESKIS